MRAAGDQRSRERLKKLEEHLEKSREPTVSGWFRRRYNDLFEPSGDTEEGRFIQSGQACLQDDAQRAAAGRYALNSLLDSAYEPAARLTLKASAAASEEARQVALQQAGCKDLKATTPRELGQLGQRLLEAAGPEALRVSPAVLAEMKRHSPGSTALELGSVAAMAATDPGTALAVGQLALAKQAAGAACREASLALQLLEQGATSDEQASMSKALLAALPDQLGPGIEIAKGLNLPSQHQVQVSRKALKLRGKVSAPGVAKATLQMMKAVKSDFYSAYDAQLEVGRKGLECVAGHSEHPALEIGSALARAATMPTTAQKVIRYALATQVSTWSACSMIGPLGVASRTVDRVLGRSEDPRHLAWKMIGMTPSEAERSRMVKAAFQVVDPECPAVALTGKLQGAFWNAGTRTDGFLEKLFWTQRPAEGWTPRARLGLVLGAARFGKDVDEKLKLLHKGLDWALADAGQSEDNKLVIECILEAGKQLSSSSVAFRAGSAALQVLIDNQPDEQGLTWAAGSAFAQQVGSRSERRQALCSFTATIRDKAIEAKHRKLAEEVHQELEKPLSWWDFSSGDEGFEKLQEAQLDTEVRRTLYTLTGKHDDSEPEIEFEDDLVWVGDIPLPR